MRNEDMRPPSFAAAADGEAASPGCVGWADPSATPQGKREGEWRGSKKKKKEMLSYKKMKKKKGGRGKNRFFAGGGLCYVRPFAPAPLSDRTGPPLISSPASSSRS